MLSAVHQHREHGHGVGDQYGDGPPPPLARQDREDEEGHEHSESGVQTGNRGNRVGERTAAAHEFAGRVQAHRIKPAHGDSVHGR